MAMDGIIGDTPNLTRRGFLMGSAAALAASGFVVTTGILDRGAEASSDEGCDDQPALTLGGVASIDGAYVAMAPTGETFGLHRLRVDGSGRVALDGQIEVDVPEDLLWGQVGVVDDRLVLVGGRPFVWEESEADYEQSAHVRASMETMPEWVPTTGKHPVTVWGVEPAAYALDPPRGEPIELPDRRRGLLGFAAAVTETPDRGMAVLVLHAEGRSEGLYASGVEVWESVRGRWAAAHVAGDLGETDEPYSLVTDGSARTVAVNDGTGRASVHARRDRWESVPSPEAGSVSAVVVDHNDTMVMYASTPGRPLRRWSLSDGGDWADEGEVSLRHEPALAAVPVQGARAETVLIGPRNAWLVSE